MKTVLPLVTRPLIMAGLICQLIFLSVMPGTTCWAMGSAPSPVQPDAVNLQVKKHYRVNADGSYTMTLYVKTLINTYKGKKDRGDFRFGYNSAYESVEVKGAKTILPDGRVVEVGSKEINDIIDPASSKASIFSGARLRVINFPAVEKGCTTELELEKRSKRGFWGMESFSLLDPCREKTVTIDLPENMPLNYRLSDKRIGFSQSTKGGRRILEWKGRQMEKAPDDPLSPPVENLDSTLIFSGFSSWKQVGAWFRDILFKSEGHKGPVLPDLDSAQDADSLYIFLSRRLEILPISIFNTRLKFQRPEETFRKKYGTQIDAALLFYRILESRGLRPRLLAASSRGIWLKGLKACFYPRLFDTLLVKVSDRYYSFDTKDMSPGVTGMDSQEALIIDTGDFETIIDARPAGSSATYDVHLLEPSTLEYRFVTRLTGADARSARKMFKDLTPEETRVADSMFFHSLSPLAAPLGPLEKKGLDPGDGPVEIKASFRVHGLPVSRGNSYVLPVSRSSKLDGIATCPEKRRTPFFIRKKESVRVEFNLALPGSCKLKAIPQAIQGSVGPVSWDNRCSPTAGGIHCVRRVEVQRGFVQNGEEFRRLKEAVFRLLDPEENCVEYVPAD